jgi:ABC-2 type transport system ATP-binding protein
MQAVIEVQGLSREFKSNNKVIKAVDQISFNVYKGKIFGLLGPNGAGKSTTIKMLTTILSPTSGELKILGYDIYKQEKFIRPRIGLLYGGEQGLYRQLSGKENLLLFGSLFHINKKELNHRIEHWLDIVGLKSAQNTLVSKYSKGMKQRLHIARSMIHDPDIIFMDEPTLGLDPKGQLELRAIIKEQKAKGKTIVLTTHDMEEAQELCDEIAFIIDGKIVQQGTYYELQDQFEESIPYEFELMNTSEQLFSQLKRYKEWDGIISEDKGHYQLSFTIPKTTQGESILKEIIDILVPYTICQITKKKIDLRSMYLQLVDKRKTS